MHHDHRAGWLKDRWAQSDITGRFLLASLKSIRLSDLETMEATTRSPALSASNAGLHSVPDISRGLRERFHVLGRIDASTAPQLATGNHRSL